MASNTLWIGIILSAVVAAIAIAIYWMYYIDITSTNSVVDTAYGQELVIVPTFAFMVLFYPLQLIVVVYQSRDSLRIGYILLTQVYQLFPSLI
jgi:putative copper export protein